MPALVLSVRDPQPVLPGEPPLVATLTVAAETASSDASMTGAFKGRIRALPRTVRRWPHHLSVALPPASAGSFTR